jgi:hypothetical protein
MFTGKIGFEDIAWGEGTETQAIGNGLSRTIHKVNAADIPYDSTNTLKQIVDKILLVAENPDLLSVSTELDDIKLLATNLAILKSVATELPGLSVLASKTDILDSLEANIKDIVILHETMVSISNNVADSKARELRIRRAANKLDSKLIAVSNMCTKHILPIKQQLDDALAQVTSTVATITAGNEMAIKLGSYELKVEMHRGCIIPKVEVDDVKKLIVWHIPKPVCATSVTAPDINIVKDSVDEYLATLGERIVVNGGVGNVIYAKDVTKKSFFHIAIGDKEVAYDLNDPKIVIFRPPENIGQLNGEVWIETQLVDNQQQNNENSSLNPLSWGFDDRVRETGSKVTKPVMSSELDPNGLYMIVPAIVDFIQNPDVNYWACSRIDGNSLNPDSITQDDINTAIQEAFGDVGLTVDGANLATLGNVIAIETEYANLPTTDQLGNELSSNDLSVLLEDDGDNKAGIYQWDTTNTRWNRLNLNFGGSVDEPVTQEEVNQALE